MTIVLLAAAMHAVVYSGWLGEMMYVAGAPLMIACTAVVCLHIYRTPAVRNRRTALILLIAICAMILPGISGSLMLVLIGMYPAVLGAVNDRDFAAVGIFVLGAVIGLALFSQILHWALANYHDVVLAGLIGLMAGSLRILWPWPDGVEGGALAAPGSDWPTALIAALIGLGVVLLISRLSERLPTSS